MPECSFACLDIPSCFSFNLGTTPEANDRFRCELLPSDKYNNSDKFVHSLIFHHFSIAVSENYEKQVGTEVTVENQRYSECKSRSDGHLNLSQVVVPASTSFKSSLWFGQTRPWNLALSSCNSCQDSKKKVLLYQNERLKVLFSLLVKPIVLCRSLRQEPITQT